MAYSGRFVAENEGVNGVCKVLLDEQERVIGAHVLGNPASEIITLAGTAIELGLTAAQWKKIVFLIQRWVRYFGKHCNPVHTIKKIYMRKYIIVPVLLAVVLVMMCHCTSDRKATVPANEYLIQGELANLSDSIVIGLYVDEGNIFNLVARDTLLNGKFSFRDTVSVTKKMLIMSDNKGFPGTWLEVWIAPGSI